MPEWIRDMGPLIIATTAIIIAIWQSHMRTHDKIEVRFDRIDDRFNKVDDRFNKIDGRFNKIEQTMSEIKGMLKVLIRDKYQD